MQPDLLFSHMFSVVEWMPDAPTQVRWKGEILKRLGTVFLMPNQFPAVREFACAALVAARDDTGGVVYLFRQAIRSGNVVLRRLGCIGLGAIGSRDGIRDLNQMLFDEVADVQLAAGLALGAIGNEEALTAMTEALLSGDPPLRKAVAESFATIPGEGHAILHDGITHEDLEVRRACAFGLARVPAMWALTDLYRAMLEDSQWYVRQAAERAFAHAREPRSSGPVLYPEPVYYEWLKTWASTRGEAVPEGQGGRQLLMAALQQSPSKVRVECARALGNLGHLPAVKSLYATLGDQDIEVRSAAFSALTNISYRTGKPLPGLS
jgi:HEAT repeat protein